MTRKVALIVSHRRCREVIKFNGVADVILIKYYGLFEQLCIYSKAEFNIEVSDTQIY